MCLVSEDAYFQSITSSIVFKAEILDPDRKVRPGLELIAGEKVNLTELPICDLLSEDGRCVCVCEVVS